MAEPYRILDLTTFTGDAWSVRATQAVPPADITRLVMTDNGTRRPLRVKVVPADAAAAGATQVVDTTTMSDFRVVKIHTNSVGVEQTEFLDSIVEVTGNEQAVGGGFTEIDVDEDDVFVVSFPSITVGTAAALLIYVLRAHEA